MIYMCFVCKEELPPENFSSYYRTPERTSRRCISCNKTINKKRKLSRYKNTINQWKNKNPDYMSEYGKKYRQNNKGYFVAKMRERYAQKLKATPAWRDKNKILAFYVLAQELTEKTGQQHHVDHIIPLKNPKVCGLHNEFNLQVLLAEDNLKKHNSF